jgi:hypothetical protein
LGQKKNTVRPEPPGNRPPQEEKVIDREMTGVRSSFARMTARSNRVWFGIGAAVVAVTVVACAAIDGNPGDHEPAHAEAPARSTLPTRSTTESMKAPRTKPVTPRKRDSVKRPPEYSQKVASFVVDCVDLVSVKTKTGASPYTENWGHLASNEVWAKCHRIATSSPARMRSMRAETAQLSKFFASAASANAAAPSTVAPTTAAPPAPPTIGPPPYVGLNCGQPVAGIYNSYHIDFGYSVRTWTPIVEWGIDYGDGNQFAAHDEATARQDVYWHDYRSPGSYPVNTWLIDAFGRRVDASCTFTWLAAGGVDSWTDSANSNRYPEYESGDLDCEDIGHEVEIDGYDPDGLDGDNDGVGCEGW